MDKHDICSKHTQYSNLIRTSSIHLFIADRNKTKYITPTSTEDHWKGDVTVKSNILLFFVCLFSLNQGTSKFRAKGQRRSRKKNESIM